MAKFSLFFNKDSSFNQYFLQNFRRETILKSLERFIATETEQKSILQQKVEKVESQLVEVKSKLQKTTEDIDREHARLSNISNAINDYINISEDAIKGNSFEKCFFFIFDYFKFLFQF